MGKWSKPRVRRNFPNDSPGYVYRLFDEEIKKRVKEILDGRRSYNDPSFVQQEARKIIREQLKGMIQDGTAI